ncbi:type IV pilin N-terminal domain-containing protein [Haloplanus aerogenes]|nr:type IV pilin N-terminal domain-containing protein [Haloplanus aerogenes]RMB18051.1 uncharacterized protein DUF1628 [Haloplanus aerogenes]
MAIRPDSDRGQSEVVSEVLAVALVVIIVTVTGTYLLQDVTTPDEETRAQMTLSVTDDRIELTHAGGEAVPEDALNVVVRVNGTEQPGITWESGSVDGDGDATFDPGERWIRVGLSLSGDARVRVLLADTHTGTVLLDRTVTP